MLCTNPVEIDSDISREIKNQHRTVLVFSSLSKLVFSQRRNIPWNFGQWGFG